MYKIPGKQVIIVGEDLSYEGCSANYMLIGDDSFDVYELEKVFKEAYYKELIDSSDGQYMDELDNLGLDIEYTEDKTVNRNWYDKDDLFAVWLVKYYGFEEVDFDSFYLF